MDVIVGFIIGFVSWIIIDTVFRKYVFREKPMGVLQIDYSDPEDGPYLFVTNMEDPDVIAKQKTVTFTVNITNYLSQK